MIFVATYAVETHSDTTYISSKGHAKELGSRTESSIVFIVYNIVHSFLLWKYEAYLEVHLSLVCQQFSSYFN